MSALSQTSALSQILPEPKNLTPNAFPLKRTNQLAGLLTIIRDQSTSRGDFIFYSDRIIRCVELVFSSCVQLTQRVPQVARRRR